MGLGTISNNPVTGFLGKRDGAGLGDGGFGSMSSGGLPRAGNIIFSADLISSVTPSIGTAGTFGRASSVTYGSAAALYGTATSGNPAQPAFAFNGTGVGSGIQIAGARKNQLTQSQNFISTGPWSNVGTFTVDQNVGSTGPDGAANVWQLTTSAINSGKRIDTGIAAASQKFIASVYARVAFSGTIAGKLTLEGSGASETVSQAITLTSTWQRFSVAVSFTAGALGNCFFQFTIDASGQAVFFDDAMVEHTTAVGFVLPRDSSPSPYIVSSGAAGTTVADDLTYPSANINPTLGTVSAWLIPTYADTAMNSNGAYILSMGTGAPNSIQCEIGPAKVTIEYGATALIGATSWAANVPVLFTWSYDDANNLMAVYKNGAVVNTSVAALTTAAASTIRIGAFQTLSVPSALDTPVSRVRIWNVKLSDTEVTQIFNAERGNYGV
jgi:hypothetical protein